jgi:hypothetical protein
MHTLQDHRRAKTLQTLELLLVTGEGVMAGTGDKRKQERGRKDKECASRCSMRIYAQI